MFDLRNGIAVLAPDSICFEERRINGYRTTPLPDNAGFIVEQAQPWLRLNFIYAAV